MPPPRSRQRGAALIVVLWVAILITLAAGLALSHSRTDVLRASAVRDQVLRHADLELALQDVIARLGETDPRHQPPLNRTPFTIKNDAGNYSVSIQDESSLVDLNAATPEMLAELLHEIGLEDGDSDRIAAQIVDWRDRDDDPRALGAEAGEYRAAGRPYTPRNAPFESVDELTQLLDLTERSRASLEPLVTVYSQSPEPRQINAPSAVQRAMKALSRYASMSTPDMSLGRSLAGSIVRIEISENMNADSSATLRVTARLTGDSRRPTTILQYSLMSRSADSNSARDTTRLRSPSWAFQAHERNRHDRRVLTPSRGVGRTSATATRRMDSWGATEFTQHLLDCAVPRPGSLERARQVPSDSGESLRDDHGQAQPRHRARVLRAGPGLPRLAALTGLAATGRANRERPKLIHKGSLKCDRLSSC